MTAALQQAISLHRKGDFAGAERLYAQALAAAPSDAMGQFLFGMLRMQQGRVAEALASYDKAVALQPRHPEFLYNRGIALLAAARREEALADFSKAVELKADYADAWINHGGVLHSLGRSAEAVASLDRAIALQPAAVPAHQNRALALRQLGRFEEAVAAYTRALTLRPNQPDLFYGRAVALLALFRRDEALGDFTRAVGLRPDYLDAWIGQGTAHHGLGRFPEAVASFERAIALRPAYALAHHNRALALQKLGRSQDAVQSYETALALDPLNTEAWNDRGYALKDLRRFNDAVTSFEQALKLAPDHAAAHTNHGATLWDLGRIDEALAEFDAALAVTPDSALALQYRGHLRWGWKKQLAEAVQDLERALALDPDSDYLRGDLLHLKMYGGDWSGLAQDLAAIDRGVRAGARVIKPFMYQAVSSSPADLLLCAKIHAAHDYPAAPALRSGAARRPGKIRLGYVCGEFRAHATAFLSAGLYESHDRSRFEVVGLDNGGSDDSAMRRRLEAGFDRLIDISGLDTAQAAARIAAEDLDILVNLNGYYGALRMDVFAHRAAPLQVNFLGFPGTLGAPYIDYIIADRFVIPADEHQFYTERVVTLPDSYQVNDSKREVPETTATRADNGLPDGAFVYCSFNHNYKLNPATFAIWMSILRQAEGAVLWILQSSEPFAGNMRRAAADHGVAPERLVFASVVGQQEHLARLPLADLFLDTQPCNAHTTASDALWMGLPLLASRGTCFAGRVAESLLHAAGLPELVAETPAAYEALAVKLAGDRALLESLRRKLVQSRGSAPLFDTGRFTRQIEAAYTRMFETWQRGGAPESFSVAPA